MRRGWGRWVIGKPPNISYTSPMDPASTHVIIASALSSVLGLAGGFLMLANFKGVKTLSRYFVSFAQPHFGRYLALQFWS